MAAARPSGRRRRLPAWLLVVAFVLVPLLEIFVLVQVGQVIGPWWTILLLLAASVLGGWLVKREGGRAWRALTDALRSGRMPARELADGALILIGGTLMLTPGFVTDAVGMALILPFSRPVFRRLLTRVVTRRLLVAGPAGGPGVTGHPSGLGDARRPGPHGAGGDVVRGEVVEEDPREKG